MRTQSYQRGVLYVVLAGIFLSFGGLFIRLLDDANPWTVLFYRSLTFSATLAVFMYCREEHGFSQRFRALRRTDMIVTASLAFGFIAYVLSIFNTSVANTVLILSTGPVFAALLGWIVLREAVALITWLTILAALSGVALMVSDGIAGGDLRGLLYALLAVMSFSVMIIALRHAPPDRDMMAPTALAGVLAASLCLPFIPTFQISLHDLLLAILLGSLQIGCGFILITLGSRSVPAAQVPLLALAETALSPLWVWLLINETPARNTLLGGGIVLAAVLLQGTVGALSNRQISREYS
jgi:drug/metabolite transporter (DMT)-like permease